MKNSTRGRPALETSVRARLLEYMKQVGHPLTGRQISQWGIREGIRIDSVTQARRRLMQQRAIQRLAGDDVDRWEVVE